MSDPSPDRAALARALDRVERLARASRLRRLAAAPARYVGAQWFRRVTYARHRRGRAVRTPTFFGHDLEVVLPAGLDVYLLGGKGHDSELRLARLMLRELAPGGAFVDVGAHFGYFSALAATLVGARGRVLACEAAPRTYEVLARNLAGLPGARARHVAVAAAPATLTFAEFPVEYSEYNTLRPEQFAGAPWLAANPPREVRVEALPLDGLLAAELPGRGGVVDLVKIDVEGAEEAAVAGMARTLADGAARLVCMEYLTAARGNDAHRAAMALLRAAGYRQHAIAPDGTLRPEDSATLERRLRAAGDDSDNVVFARPASALPTRD